MSDLREALLALEALLQAAPGIPVLVSLTFERKKRGFFTVMGDPLLPSLARLAEAGAAAVGANCSMTSGDMADLAREVLPARGLRCIFQPNAGTPEVTSAGIRYAQKPEEFAADLSALVSAPPPAGSRLAALGGCCGTDPSFIAALRARLTGRA
jgi:methionine synthase I (cobalamin-dependent)